MKKLIFASAAACGLAIATVPALAQADTDPASYPMTDEQEVIFLDWPAEQRMTYQEWPVEAQEYYWTLDDGQQDIWWNTLNNDQRVTIVMMEPEQRMAAWQSINSQLSGAATGTTTRTTSAKGKIKYVSNPVVEPIPASEAGPPPAKLPICKPDQQDNCINRGAV